MALGYLPLTLLGILVVMSFVKNSSSWGAVLAGGVLILLWSTQLALGNLLILWLRFDRRFAAKALAVALGNTILLPGLGMADQQLDWLRAGRPDIAAQVTDASQSACRLVGEPELRRYRYTAHNFGYEVMASLHCAGDRQPTQRCRWLTWYSQSSGRWDSLAIPMIPSCRGQLRPPAR